MKVNRVLIFCLVLAVPTVAADTLTENFQGYSLTGFNPQTSPDQNWYDYSESDQIGLVSTTDPDIVGTQHMLFTGRTTTDVTSRRAAFTLEVPAQLTESTFYIKGVPVANNTTGSQQFVSVQSSAPILTLVDFYLFCTNATYTQGCELRVKFDTSSTTGSVLVNASLNTTFFKIRMVPNWLTGEYRLYVNDVDDGTFPFLEIPEDFGRILVGQYRADIGLNMSFDDWTVIGTVNGTGSTVEGDVATGLKNFATDIRFRTSGSKFFFGFLLFLVLNAAVIVPLLALGLDNTVIPAISFFSLLCALWMIYMEFWPDWIGIGLIVAVAGLVGAISRKLLLGIRDASQGAGLVAGSLGYFIIAASLLAFSGYATDTITVPTGPAEQQGVNETESPDQSFVGAVTECIFTGGAFTFGLRGDCSQDTVSKTWVQITDIFGWVRTGLDFLFQLLTFRLPIPVIFNVMIVLPPAAALATFAILVIRGSSS